MRYQKQANSDHSPLTETEESHDGDKTAPSSAQKVEWRLRIRQNPGFCLKKGRSKQYHFGPFCSAVFIFSRMDKIEIWTKLMQAQPESWILSPKWRIKYQLWYPQQCENRIVLNLCVQNADRNKLISLLSCLWISLSRCFFCGKWNEQSLRMHQGRLFKYVPSYTFLFLKRVSEWTFETLLLFQICAVRFLFLRNAFVFWKSVRLKTPPKPRSFQLNLTAAWAKIGFQIKQ